MAKKSNKELAELLMLLERLTAEEQPVRANGYPKPNKNTHDQWTDSSGTKYWVHRWKLECRDGCAIHAPSMHTMNAFPQFMRADKSYLIERLCPHGVGHPDPDSYSYFKSKGMNWMGVHGCDGCCEGAYNAAVV